MMESKCNNITSLNKSINQLEQYSRRNRRSIFGIEEEQGETKKTNLSLKGLGKIVQMRENGAKVVTSMLDVQLKKI